MFAIKLNPRLSRFISAHLPHHVPLAAVAEEASARAHRRMDNLIRFFWALIAVKCWAVVWLVDRYNVPFNPMWVVTPTVLFAALATAVYYYWRE
jgi:hypothetical protein